MSIDTLAEQLRTLPRLARQAALRNLDITLSHVNESGIRTAPTSTVPPGVNLDRPAIDQGREWPNLLVRLSQCVRVVCEECPSVYPAGPDLSVEGRETWVGECGWLLKTMQTWRHEPWCVEWIGTEVAAIHRKLAGKLERRLPDGTRRCSVCGEELLLRTTRTLAWAECDKCARVVAMSERVTLTTKQAADVLGITPDGVRMQVMRGKLERTDDGKVAGDALDWARHKLGLPVAGDAC